MLSLPAPAATLNQSPGAIAGALSPVSTTTALAYLAASVSDTLVLPSITLSHLVTPTPLQTVLSIPVPTVTLSQTLSPVVANWSVVVVTAVVGDGTSNAWYYRQYILARRG